ncbi:uncharacterized protein PG998_009679 [Apiospora kogelbergensis]|uniref:uncharacterized protein n=1 Tax=Apiospora kogelbergensis TaxID=1337665 RepID=UPI0031302B3A
MEGNAPAPLADYFWIAGIETISYQDFLPLSTPTQVDSTITEDGEPEEEESPSRENAGASPPKSHYRTPFEAELGQPTFQIIYTYLGRSGREYEEQ